MINFHIFLVIIKLIQVDGIQCFSNDNFEIIKKSNIFI